MRKSPQSARIFKDSYVEDAYLSVGVSSATGGRRAPAVFPGSRIGCAALLTPNRQSGDSRLASSTGVSYVEDDHDIPGGEGPITPPITSGRNQLRVARAAGRRGWRPASIGRLMGRISLKS